MLGAKIAIKKIMDRAIIRCPVLPSAYVKKNNLLHYQTSRKNKSDYPEYRQGCLLLRVESTTTIIITGIFDSLRNLKKNNHFHFFNTTISQVGV